MAEPTIRVETREELIYLLAEATAVEHSILCCYLYAAWSLKRTEEDGLTLEQVESVQQWRTVILSVAVEEMGHLALAANLASTIGAGPHFSRPEFPIPPGVLPSGLILELSGFSPPLLDHFIYLERPEGVELEDATGFDHPVAYDRTVKKGRLMPGAQDYETIGHLYRGILHGFEGLVHMHGADDVFCGDPEAQIGPAEASLPGLIPVTDLASAKAAINTIIEQGEGAPSHSEDSHYQRFVRIKDEYEAFLADDPTFEPAFPVARNPVSRQSWSTEPLVLVNEPEAELVLDLANSLYSLMVRALVQSWGRDVGYRDDKAPLMTLAIELMFVLEGIACHLASLPASPDHPGVNAGMTFSLPGDIQRHPEGRSEQVLMKERLEEMATQAAHLFDLDHPLAKVPKKLTDIGKKLNFA
ncbi:ferritin-like protein [Aeromicrobium panaciterrae]|uniref:ferritin-like domain-containing protein n=1 Tax=Aeromicrobium panaciterrae TaxID=363861 RepID=UPI0031E2A0EB